jgi:hypothetical protein
MDQFFSLLAAASDIPATRLLGRSPQGLNATGESDITNYYDSVSGKQESDMMDSMLYIDEAMIRSLYGEYPEGLEWEFNPLWQMSEKEIADMNLARSNTLLNLRDLGVPDKALLKDVQESGLSNNLDDEMIDKALKELSEEIDEDDDTKLLLEGDEPDEPIKPKPDEPIKAT